MAAEAYDLDDGLIRRSPPLERQIVKLRPSPSPDYLPPPERSPTPERHSRSSNSTKRRRPKAQASQGDTVLIGFMGGLNHPDIATRAGEEPLPQSDDSELEEQMDEDGALTTRQGDTALIHLAENALPLVENNDGQTVQESTSPKSEDTRRTRPRLLTQTHTTNSETTAHFVPDSSDAAADGNRIEADGVDSSNSPSRSISSKKDDSDSVAISPLLRKFTIPNSERSPTETLPAMHHSPPSPSSKSPNGQRNLPSLRAIKLEPLLESRSTNDAVLGGTGRSPFPIGNGALNASPTNSITPRPGQFPSPQTRVNVNHSSSYPHGHPSPAYSDASPLDRDSANMSPPAARSTSQVFYSNGRTPQGEELTPQSAESHTSSSSLSTAPSPLSVSHQVDVTRSRPTLPPLVGLPNVPLMTGSFRCNYAGCNAAPFQTQYLLK